MIRNKRVRWSVDILETPLMNPSNAEAAESNPIQCVSPFLGLETLRAIQYPLNLRAAEAWTQSVIAARKSTQQKPKHEVHTCFPHRLVTCSSANRPIRSANPYPNTRKPRLIWTKKLRLSCKKRILEAESGWHVQSKRDDGKKEKEQQGAFRPLLVT